MHLKRVLSPSLSICCFVRIRSRRSDALQNTKAILLAIAQKHPCIGALRDPFSFMCQALDGIRSPPTPLTSQNGWNWGLVAVRWWRLLALCFSDLLSNALQSRSSHVVFTQTLSQRGHHAMPVRFVCSLAIAPAARGLSDSFPPCGSRDGCWSSRLPS